MSVSITGLNLRLTSPAYFCTYGSYVPKYLVSGKA